MSSPPRPISDCEVRDPRIRRTRQLLQGAFWTLLKTKGFDQIAVQDITQAATVNRATFYDHYTDKYALLEGAVAGRFHALLLERKVEYNASCAAGANALILATCEFLLQTRGDETECRRQNAFEPWMDAAVVAAIRRVLQDGERDHPAQPMADLPAAAASWAIYGAVKEWFSRPQRPAAEAVVPVVLELVLPLLPRSAAVGPRPL